jgi:hypothetical protein
MRLWKAMLVVIAAAAATPAIRGADVGVVGNAPEAKSAKGPPHYVEIPISGPRAELQSAIAANPLSSEEDAKLPPLIRQLADADFRKREEAVDQLKAMGPGTLPSLEQARDRATDPELANRADSVIRFLKRAAAPPAATTVNTDPFQFRGGGRFRGGFGRMEGNVNLRVTLDNGTKTVEVNENRERTIRISDGPNGIDMAITNGDNVREVHARTPEMLKKQDAEAFNLYEKWMGRGGPGGVIHWRGGGGRGQIVLPPAIPAPARVRPVAPQQINPFNNQPNVAPGADQQQQREMLRMLEDLRRAQGGAAVNPVDPAQQAADFLQRIERDQREARRQAEVLQQQVAEIERRAMDAAARNGNAPAPAIVPGSGRLGVRILEGPEPDTVTVTEVLPGERAEKLGLKPMDTIRSLNGQKVTDGDSLRQAITSAKGAVIVEVVRDGQTLKLAEK